MNHHESSAHPNFLWSWATKRIGFHELAEATLQVISLQPDNINQRVVLVIPGWEETMQNHRFKNHQLQLEDAQIIHEMSSKLYGICLH